MLAEEKPSTLRKLETVAAQEGSQVPLRKTYFRLREIKQQNLSPIKYQPKSSPKNHTDFYSHQQATLEKMKKRDIKLSSTANNFFSNFNADKISSIEARQTSPLRKTFFNQKSSEKSSSPQRPPSSQSVIFRRTSLNLHTQNIFKDENNDNYLNKYQIVKELGKGSFSTVFLARKRQNQRRNSPTRQSPTRIHLDSSATILESPTKFSKQDNPESSVMSEREEIRREASIKENCEESVIDNNGEPVEQAEKYEEGVNKDLEKNTVDLKESLPAIEELVAIKVYEKFKMNKDPHKFKNIRKEVNIMQNLDNEGVLKLIESVETLTKINLVVEYGGQYSLLEYVKRNYPLPISKVKDISYQLIKAIAYLHDKNIVHRDIKLQNVLIHNEKIKLIDFGFSCLTHKQQKLTVICGTPNYMAPEVISKKEYIGEQADMWSYGVVVYALAEGRHPFKADTYNQLERLVNRGKFEFKKITDQPYIDFVKRILKLKGSDRPTARQLVDTKWFQTP